MHASFRVYIMYRCVYCVKVWVKACSLPSNVSVCVYGLVKGFEPRGGPLCVLFSQCHCHGVHATVPVVQLSVRCCDSFSVSVFAVVTFSFAYPHLRYVSPCCLPTSSSSSLERQHCPEGRCQSRHP